jgi:deoxyribonuclease-4
LVQTVHRAIGMGRLAFVHANDSARPCGSRRDRHANIGEGHVGIEGFRSLLQQDDLRRVPWILETPDLEKRVIDRTTLEALAVENLVMEGARGS